jgi:NMD protein affecting ribosome stability and mRNA decay
MEKHTKHVNYFEAILQLREPDDETIGFVNNWIKANSEDVTLAKRKKVKNGFDYYLSSNRFTIELGRYLYRTFGGELKITKKQFSQHRQTSKLLYRMTVLFRSSPFKPGYLILLEGKAYLITSLTKKDYLGMDLDNLKTVELEQKRLLRSAEKCEPMKVIISKVRPSLEIIHPETFQSVPVRPIQKNSKLIPGERMQVLIHEEKVWAIPNKDIVILPAQRQEEQ